MHSFASFCAEWDSFWPSFMACVNPEFMARASAGCDRNPCCCLWFTCFLAGGNGLRSSGSGFSNDNCTARRRCSSCCSRWQFDSQRSSGMHLFFSYIHTFLQSSWGWLPCWQVFVAPLVRTYILGFHFLQASLLHRKASGGTLLWSTFLFWAWILLFIQCCVSHLEDQISLEGKSMSFLWKKPTMILGQWAISSNKELHTQSWEFPHLLRSLLHSIFC